MKRYTERQLSLAEIRVLHGVAYWAERGARETGYPHLFVPRGGQWRCAERLVELGLAEFANADDGRHGIQCRWRDFERLEAILHELGKLQDDDAHVRDWERMDLFAPFDMVETFNVIALSEQVPTWSDELLREVWVAARHGSVCRAAIRHAYGAGKCWRLRAARSA